MVYRGILAAASVLFLVGCQQAGPEFSPAAGVTSPSSLSLKPVDVPFTGTVAGDATFDFATNPKACPAGFTTITVATGTASHMGVTTWRSQHCAGENHELTDADLVLTAANGDEIHVTYVGGCGALGEVGEPFTCTGTAVFSGGTGRFEHASGSAEWRAIVTNEGFSDLSWPGRWEWNGSIRY